MTLPLSSPFTSGTKVTKAQLDQLVTAIDLLARGSLGDSGAPAGTVTLATLGTSYAGSVAAVTFTLTDQRRVKISTKSRYSPGTTGAGKMTVQSGYNTGSSVAIGSVNLVGREGHIASPSGGATGLNGSQSETSLGTVLLAAGTYTAYPVVIRQWGGDATDAAGAFFCLVEDVGAS